MVVPLPFQQVATAMNDVTKSELRAHYRALRADFADSLDERERAIAFSKAPAPLAEHFKPGCTVAAYIPVGSEADPRALLGQASEAGCLTALPYVTSRASPMQFLHWSPSNSLVEGPFGLQQPESSAEPCEPDVILVPLVAFDSRLMRLGQGAGHYDRALSLLDNAFTVGIAWSVQQAPALPTDPWDIPLNAILTEKAWIAP
jgi:5-formyltetrahydrofolate cyclo-ligase